MLHKLKLHIKIAHESPHKFQSLTRCRPQSPSNGLIMFIPLSWRMVSNDSTCTCSRIPYYPQAHSKYEFTHFSVLQTFQR